MMELTHDEKVYLKCYAPNTYGMNLPRKIAKSLEEKKLVEWLPPSQCSGTIYGLTEHGRKVAAELDDATKTI